jgi:hypothetical protein
MHAALLALLCPQRPKPAPGTRKDATGHSAGPAALGQYLAMGLVDVVCGCGSAEGHAGSRREREQAMASKRSVRRLCSLARGHPLERHAVYQTLAHGPACVILWTAIVSHGSAVHPGERFKSLAPLGSKPLLFRIEVSEENARKIVLCSCSHEKFRAAHPKVKQLCFIIVSCCCLCCCDCLR